MNSIYKKYIKVGTKNIFVQILGNGPAIALMHPSPNTSDMLLPLAERLANDYTVICIDTPGYGKSDGLDSEPTSISEYTEILHQLFNKMGISRLSLYGSATGSQLAIRYALDHSDMVSHIFLDNAAHFDDDLRVKILANYFPDLSPTQDGSHLNTLWDIVSNMFVYFPWCLKTPEYALNRPQLPLRALHAIAMDYLKAGSNYAYAYRAAFIHEHGRHVQQLKTKTTIFRWTGSIILPYIDALVNHEFSENVEIVDLEPNPAARMDVMVSSIIDKNRYLSNYEMPDALGIDFIETSNTIQTIDLPEISIDGQYLIEAWKLLSQYNKDASPEEIQELMIEGYTNSNK